MQNYRVLYAEDDQENQRVFKEILSTYFNDVKCANDGLEAISFFDANGADIVITDLNMPKADGLRVAKYIKKNSPQTPVLIISAHSDYQKLTQAIEIGVDGYTLKPIRIEKFIAQINRITDRLNLLKRSQHYEKLLKEHKEAIDRSAIVSKTDIHGRITYVNEAFAKISQYAPEELLGKPHNIIRHPDVPAAIFKDLSYIPTKKSKKRW